MKNLIIFINRIYDTIINFGVYHLASKKELNRIIKISGKNKNCSNIMAWINKWEALGKFNRDYYRVFSKYVGQDVNIVPDDLLHNVIEPILNPKRFISTYEDKNLFDKMLWSSFGCFVTAPTFIRTIDGINYDSNYIACNSKPESLIPVDIDKLIVKPSIDSSSGRNIAFYERSGGRLSEK